MADHTAIAWCDSTFNPWIGCTKVSPGCDHCYAEALMDHRWHKVKWGPGQARRRTSAANWQQPLRWERQHEAFAATHGRRRRVFCASLADVFDTVAKQWQQDLFALIRATPHLDWLLLTKRIGNVKRMAMAAGVGSMLAGDGFSHGLPGNVWLGITVVNQEEADRDIPKLLATEAAVRFLSVEPMLGPISFEGLFASDKVNDGTNALEAIDWVICGGESGHQARPMHPDWCRSLRDQCAAVEVPFFFKQWGGRSTTAGGCELDGREVKAWPAAR